MWRSWRKLAVNIHDTSNSSSATTSVTAAAATTTSPFSFTTFKDIQNLCSTDDYSSPSPSPRSSIFHRVRLANSVIRSLSAANKPLPPPSPPCITFPGADSRIIIYFTSLRVVRPTFEDCRVVRSILRGFRVAVDERDLSMDSSFRSELLQIFGGGRSKLKLPAVFIGGKYIGGADEVRELHEAGELKKMVEGLKAVEARVCDTCGGHGFVLCERCDGSHKLYIEKGGFKCCSCCNENGLVRCPSCSL